MAPGDSLTTRPGDEPPHVARPRHDELTTRSDACLADFMGSLADLDAEYFRAMKTYLNRDLGVRCCVVGSMAFGLAGASVMADPTCSDVVDVHGYHDHPQFKTEWQGGWTVSGKPLLAKPDRHTLSWLGAHRVAGRPFVVSEFNECWPNPHDAEGLPLAAAWAARQGWDALYVFDFNKDGNFRRTGVESWFDIDGHPVKTAQLIVASALLVRGDLYEAEETHLACLPRREAVATAGRFKWFETEQALAKLGLPVADREGWGWKLRFVDSAVTSTLKLDMAKGHSPRYLAWPGGDGGKSNGVAKIQSGSNLEAIGRCPGRM